MFGFARAERHDGDVFLHKHVRYLGQQIKSLLIRKTRHDADQRPLDIFFRQLELGEQIAFANLLSAQVSCRVARRNQAIHFGIPNRIIHAIQDAHQAVGARAHHAIQAVPVFAGLNLLAHICDLPWSDNR